MAALVETRLHLLRLEVLEVEETEVLITPQVVTELQTPAVVEVAEEIVQVERLVMAAQAAAVLSSSSI